MISDPQWYKDAVVYEVRVGAFFDSDGDGLGDFKGLTEKLDYLQDLGVNALWLLPFYPSPFRDDGYDIADYTSVHTPFGTLPDFKAFVREAHARGIRVITELVLNHTSDQHPWFQRAREADSKSPERNFYVWNNAPEKYKDARIIFKDYESSNWTWDPVAKAYYWHRFYSHQPDLNFENPAVQRAVIRVLDFWLNLGVDGMRLDAVPYLYEKEGTNCENLPETHAFLKKIRSHADRKYKNRMFLAEANQWPEDAVTYFGRGDECHMAFHFPIMPRLFMAIHMEDRYPIIDILDQTPPIPETCQWALFLRNHDELTLEMVTDEERDYMYRVYAAEPEARINLGIRRRLSPLLRGNRRKIELMNGLLFSLPGTPVLYYGDEIGMGDNIYLGDRNSVRTPMQWTADRNAGFSRANPQKLYLPVNIDSDYHYETVNTEAQLSNPHSILWWMKRLIALRKRYKAFGRGSIKFLKTRNPKVLVFIREYGEEKILVVANLSRFVQPAEINMKEYKGSRPIELFGRIEFPLVGDLPYFLTLGPHSFYWFSLVKASKKAAAKPPSRIIPALSVSDQWQDIFSGTQKTELEESLPDFLSSARWFGARARKIKSVRLKEAVPLFNGLSPSALTIIHVDFAEGQPQDYILPVGFAWDEARRRIEAESPESKIAELTVLKKSEKREGILFDATVDPSFSASMLDAMGNRRRFKGRRGTLVCSSSPVYRKLRGQKAETLPAKFLKAEQSNTSVLFGDRFVMKLFRRGEEGVNPDLEISRFLMARKYESIPPAAGSVEYKESGKPTPGTVFFLQGFVPNQGDAWRYTLDELSRYFERTAPKISENVAIPALPASIVERLDLEPTELAKDVIGPYFESARLLGQRTAELHIALASEKKDRAFVPEPFSSFSQRSLYQSLRDHANKVFQAVRKKVPSLRGDDAVYVKSALKKEKQILAYFERIRKTPIDAMQIRCHGDYHLGQVLYTGRDFTIIDFEGEPARSLSERKLKRSPLRDVAGMLRSFHYAVFAALREMKQRGTLTESLIADQEKWGRFWYDWVSATFLKSYLDVSGKISTIPQKRDVLELLLNTFLLEKSIYELAYEINNRPDWIRIPAAGLSMSLSSIEQEGEK